MVGAWGTYFKGTGMAQQGEGSPSLGLALFLSVIGLAFMAFGLAVGWGARRSSQRLKRVD
jgi:hypothetical protein